MKITLRSLLSVALLLIGILVMSLGVIIWLALDDLPDIEALKDYKPPQSTIVYDRNNEIVGRFFDERRTVISLKKLPAHVKLAFIAAEDADFFEHRGIDYFGLMRAILLEIKHRTVGGRRVGGSTITQQTARTMLLSSTQTYVRKVKEIILAQRIEKALSKDEILHLYLNQIYFGNGAYGIEEAAQTYFFKPAHKLTLFEAAALASIPKSPNRINPLSSDTDRLLERQHYVLDQMVKHKFIDIADADAAKAAPLFSDVADNKSQSFAPYFLRSVKVELLSKVSDEVIRRGGLKVYSTLDARMQKSAEEAMTRGLRTLDKNTGYRGPIFRPEEKETALLNEYLEAFKKRAFIAQNLGKVWDLSKITKEAARQDLKQAIQNIRLIKPAPGAIVGGRIVNVNDKAQMAYLDLGSKTITLPFSTMSWAQPLGKDQKKLPLKKISDILKSGDIVLVKLQGIEKNQHASLEQEPIINGGLVALDVKTGGVLAMVGGYDFERSPFNRIMQAKRQVGSGLKPLIYAVPIESGIFTASSLITDMPKAFLDPETNKFWQPRNHDNLHRGDITIRTSIVKSINVGTVIVLEKIGFDAFFELARNIELITKDTPYPRNLTIALGSAENYPISVANAMRIFPNYGIYSPYHLIEGIKHADKSRENILPPPQKQVIKPETAFIISHILKDVISYAKHETHLYNVKADLAGKTGTTNNARSTWFIGYSPQILALVYVGYDDNRSISADAYGITTAFPTWANFMNSIPLHQEEMRFMVPENIEWRYVDRATGRVIPYPVDNPEFATGLMEAFMPGTAPELSDEINISKALPDNTGEAAFAP
jgi:penicillin-binding protein 1A